MDKIIQIVVGKFSSNSSRNNGKDDLVGLASSGRIYINEGGVGGWELFCEPPKMKPTPPKKDYGITPPQPDLPKPMQIPPVHQPKEETPVFDGEIDKEPVKINGKSVQVKESKPQVEKKEKRTSTVQVKKKKPKKERPVFGNYPCDVCDYPFDTKAAMIRHKVRKHENPHAQEVKPRGTITSGFYHTETPINANIVDCSNDKCNFLRSFVKHAGYKPDPNKEQEFCHQRCYQEFQEHQDK